MQSLSSASTTPPTWLRQTHGGARFGGSTQPSRSAPTWQQVVACHQQGSIAARHARLLVVTQHLDASLHIGLLAALRPHHHEAHVIVIDDMRLRRMGVTMLENLAEYHGATHLVLYRYWGCHLIQLLDMARRRAMATVGFLDDNLFALPAEHNPSTRAHFSQPEIRRRLAQLVQHTDIMVASTKTLAKQLSKIRRSTPVVAPGLPCSIPIGAITPHKATNARGKVVGYMASASHQQDFELIAPALAWLMQRRPDLTLELFGSIAMPQSLKIYSSQIKHHAKASNYSNFAFQMKQLRWDVGLAPLQNNRFNAGKTPIKWLEYMQAGVPMLTTPGPVYRCQLKADCCAVAPVWKFGSALAGLLDDAERRDHLVKNSLDLARSAYSDVQHGQQWMTLLGSVQTQ